MATMEEARAFDEIASEIKLTGHDEEGVYEDVVTLKLKDKDQRLDEKKEDLDGAQEGPVQEAQRLEDRLPEPFKKTKIWAFRDTLRGMQTSESKARKKLLKGAGARKKR